MIRYILLADDDKDDRFFFQQALSELNPDILLETVKDGEQLMEWLYGHLEELPDVLFLDLNMPRKNGFTCLEEIRNNRLLQHLFVAIYSTSTSTKDITEAFEKGANIFINKPNGFEDLKTILEKILTLEVEEYVPHVASENFVLSRN